MYEYYAELRRVVDGDTVDVTIDCGFKMHIKERVRLKGINTPECRTRDLEEKAKGLAAKARLIELLENMDNKFILVSHGVGKFGRCLGDIRNVNNQSINKQLIAEGHGKAYFGGKR